MGDEKSVDGSCGSSSVCGTCWRWWRSAACKERLRPSSDGCGNRRIPSVIRVRSPALSRPRAAVQRDLRRKPALLRTRVLRSSVCGTCWRWWRSAACKERLRPSSDGICSTPILPGR